MRQVCSDAVLQALVEPFDASVCLWIVVCHANVLYSSITEESGEVCREKLEPIICGKGMRHTTTCK